MESFSPREDNKESQLAGIVRASAGIGIGFGAYWAFRSNYRNMRRRFLGLNITDNAKRLIERHFAFTNMDQQMTEFERRLGIKDMLEVMPLQSAKEAEIDTLLRKERQIRDAMGPAQAEVLATVRAASSITESPNIARFESEFTSFRDEHFERAITTSESMLGEEFPGKGSQQLTDKIKSMSMSQIEEMGRQLTVVLDRVRLIKSRVSSFRQNVDSIVRSVQRRAGLTEGTDKYQQWMEATNAARTSLDSQFKQFADTMKEITDLRPVSAPIVTNKDMYTKFWTVQGMRPQPSFRKMIGPEAHRSLGKMIRESYEDRFLNTSPQDAIERTEKAMTGIKGIIEHLQNETVSIGGKPSKVYERINVAMSPGERTITISAVSAVPTRKDAVMTFDVAKRKMGAAISSRGGKDFSVPYTRQRDLLSRQIEEQVHRAPWRSQTPISTAENIRNEIVNNMTNFTKTGLSDMILSAGIDQRMMPFEERFYKSGFENFNRILKNKMSRGGTLHVSIEGSGKGGRPSRIGWVLKDSAGKTLDGKYFMFGTGGGTPSHLVGASIDGSPVVRMIGENDVGQIVDALSKVMQHPKLKGHGVKIVMSGDASGIGTLMDMAEKQSSGATDKIAAIRLATREETLINSSTLTSVSGYAMEAKPLDMFRILQAHGAKDPELRKLIESELLKIGIPGLTDMGREVFKKGTTNAFQRAYMDALFPQIAYLAMTGKKKGRYGDFLKEMDAVKSGRIPGRLVGAGYTAKQFQALKYDYNRNVSPSTWLAGGLGPLEYNITGPFPHLRKGRGDRRRMSTPLKWKLSDQDLQNMKERLRVQGKYADPAGVLMETAYEVPFDTLHLIDMGNTSTISTDEFAISEATRRITVPSQKTHIVNRRYLSRSITDSSGNVKIGTRLMPGSVLGRLGPENVVFEGLDRSSHGTIVEASNLTNGDIAIVIDEASKIGGGLTALSGANAGIISPDKALEAVLPYIDSRFGAFTASAVIEKNNPGVMMAMMWKNMFHHAGTDVTRQRTLRGVIGRKLRGKVKTGSEDINFFPIYTNKRTQQLDFKGGSPEYWHKLSQLFDFGDIMEVAEEYNMLNKGAFGVTKTFFDATQPKHRKPVQITDSMLESYRRLMTQEGTIQANVGIAMNNLRRETSSDPTKSMPLIDAEKVVSMSSELLTSGGSVFDALVLTRPDIVAQLRREGKEVNRVNFFEKIPAYLNGFVTDKEGRTLAAAVGEPLSLRDRDVFAQVGKVKEGNYRMAWMNAAKNLEGSQKLLNVVSKTAYEQSSFGLARMVSLPISTGASTPKGMQLLTTSETASRLRNFISQPHTKGLAAQGWMPSQTLYELPDGSIVTEKMAVEELDIPRQKFREAIAEGKAKVCTDPGKLGSRMMHPADIEEIVSTQSFVMAFKSHHAVEVKGSTSLASYDRMLIGAASRKDLYPMEFTHPVSGAREKYYIKSPALAKMQEILQMTTSGIPMDPSGKNTVSTLHDYIELTGRDSLKRQLRARLMTMDIPVIRLGAFAASPVDMTEITTHAHAKDVMRMAGRGLTVGENLVAGRNEPIEALMGTMSWDEMKYVAKEILGNVKSSSPRAVRLKYLGGDKALWEQLGQAPTILDPKSADALGVLQSIHSTQQENRNLMAAFKEHAMGGRVPFTGFGAKYPLVDQHKFVGGMIWRSKSRADNAAAWASGSGGIGIVPFISLFKKKIDSDGDLVQMMVDSSTREGVLDIIKKNKFMPQLDNEETVVETHGGLTTTFNKKTGVFSKVPFTVPINEIGGFNRGATVESEVITKQYAGQVTVIAENVNKYLNRMLSGKGGSLANDLGQRDLHADISRNTWEALAPFIEEGALKGKAEGATTDLTKEFVNRIGHYPTFVKFAKDLEERSQGTGQKEIRKLFTKIPGTETTFPSSGGVTAMELMLDAMRHGKSFKDGIFSGLTSDQAVAGTSMAASKIYGMRSSMVEAMGRMFETQGIPTRYNSVVQEGVLSSLKKNLQNDMGQKTWKRVSTGMGWAAAAGAVYFAANIFNGDGMGFLGQRAGTGAEPFNWTFTRPEYKMAGMLDQPYDNPYAKNPAYVVMDNPNNESKRNRLSQVENRDFLLIHQSVTGEKVRDTINSPLSVDEDQAVGRLNRFGHV